MGPIAPITRLDLGVLGLLVGLISTNLGPYSSNASIAFIAFVAVSAVYLLMLRAPVLIRAVRVPFAGCAMALAGAYPILILMTASGFQRADVTNAIASSVGLLGALTLATQPEARPALRRIVFGAMTFSVGVNLYEFIFDPNVLSVAPGRAAGFYENPNRAGQVIGGLAVFLLATRERKVDMADVLFAGMALLGVLVTFSRGSLLVYALAAAWVLHARMRARGATTGAYASAFAVGAGFAMMLTYAVASTQLSDEAALRVQSLFSGDLSDGSALSRFALLAHFAGVFLQNPIYGSGALTSLQEAIGPHNMYLAIAVDFGLVGLGAYVLVLLLGLRLARNLEPGSPDRTAVAGLLWWAALNGVFSHNLLYDAAPVAVIGLMLGAGVAGARSGSAGFAFTGLRR